jgi:polyisoprenoid-binding protein YceI
MKRTMISAAAITTAVALALLAGRGASSTMRTAYAAPGPAPAPAATHYSVATTGNAARYRVREQLMQHDLPNDAVGETPQISGGITLDASGSIVPAQSRIVVQVGQLTSDQSRRDGYVRRRILATDSFPTVEFVPTSYRGITAAQARSATGPVTFDLVGDLTVRGVTHPTTWRVTAKRDGDQVTGSAATHFTFADFGLTQPRLPFILSVADTIALEYDFTLVRDGGAR